MTTSEIPIRSSGITCLSRTVPFSKYCPQVSFSHIMIRRTPGPQSLLRCTYKAYFVRHTCNHASAPRGGKMSLKDQIWPLQGCQTNLGQESYRRPRRHTLG